LETQPEEQREGDEIGHIAPSERLVENPDQAKKENRCGDTDNGDVKRREIVLDV
jgi:hypothetical protein